MYSCKFSNKMMQKKIFTIKVYAFAAYCIQITPVAVVQHTTLINFINIFSAGRKSESIVCSRSAPDTDTL